MQNGKNASFYSVRRLKACGTVKVGGSRNPNIEHLICRDCVDDMRSTKWPTCGHSDSGGQGRSWTGGITIHYNEQHSN